MDPIAEKLRALGLTFPVTGLFFRAALAYDKSAYVAQP